MIDDEEFRLSNSTVFRGFLAHMQSIARRRAALIAEAIDHPDSTPETRTKLKRPDALITMLESLRVDVRKVLGVELIPFEQLPAAGSFTRQKPGGRDELRITMKALKVKADRARRKDPSITLMQSWDISKHDDKDTTDDR